MPWYRKKAPVEMFQWTGQPQEQWPEWAQQLANEHRIQTGPVRNADFLVLRTDDGWQQCSLNDWIARDSRGQPYPVGEREQAKTYELVEV